MSLTIIVNDPLASALLSEAADRNVPVQQFALNVLARAVGQPNDWPVSNRRRLALIQKQFGGELTTDEAAELQELQIQADQHLESLDVETMKDVSQMQQAAMEALDDSNG